MESQTTFLTRIKNHITFFIIILIVFVLDIWVIKNKPAVPPYTELKPTIALLSLSLESVCLILTISIYLFSRWIKTGKSNKSTLSWAIGFLVFIMVFFGLTMQALGISWADSTDPRLFFIYRNPMIIWTALMYYGIAQIITQNKKWQNIPTYLILVAGYLIFIFGLLVSDDPGAIDATMYIFIYTLLVPISILVVYLFWLYGKNSRTKSPKIISFGFLLFAISYVLWAPTHGSSLYYTSYVIFLLSLIAILIGFILIPFEMELLQLRQEQ